MFLKNETKIEQLPSFKWNIKLKFYMYMDYILQLSTFPIHRHMHM